MDKRLLTLAVCFVGSLSFAQENRRAPWFQPVRAPSGGGGGSVYNDLIVNDLANVSTASDQTSYETPGYQPAPDALVLVTVINSKASAPDIPTFSGNGLTWVQIGTSNFNTLEAPTQRITMFRGQGASPTPGPGTADFGGATQTGCIIEVVEFQGADATAANGANALVQTNLNGADSTANPSISFRTPSLPGTNAIFWAYGDSVDSDTDATAQTNLMELKELTYSTPATGGTFDLQMNGQAGTSLTNTATSRSWAGICVEVKPDVDTDSSTRPVLVQSLATFEPGEPGNNYTNWLPNPTLGGNFLAVHVVFNYAAGRTISISDDQGNTYTRAGSVAEGMGMFFEDWFATNIAANTRALYFTTSSDNGITFHTEITEWAHVASYDPVDSYTNNFHSAATRGVALAGGLTTANDGNLVLSYYANVSIGQLEGFAPPNYLGGGGKWIACQTMLGTGSQCAIQARAGGLNPIFGYVATSPQYWQNSVVAYKRGSGGSLPSPNAIRIVRLQWDDTTSAASCRTVMPTDGNLLVFTDTHYKAEGHVTDITSPLGTWTEVVTTNADNAQIWYATNTTPRNNPPVPINLTYAGGQCLIGLWDIADAADSPYDVKAENHIGSVPSGADATDNPVIKPTTSNGLVITCAQWFVGPESRSLDSSHIFDAPYYIGSTDGSHYNNGDSTQHYFNSDTAPVHFGQHLAGGPSGTDSLAVAFKGK